MNKQDQKIENIKQMFMNLGNIYKKIKNSELKTEYKRLLYFLKSRRGDLKGMMAFIDKKALEGIKGINSKYVILFWKNIKEIIHDTYLKNKQIDMD